MKTLIVLRHARALPATAGQDDAARPLAPSGRSDAGAMAAWLSQGGWRPDIIVCSAAARTRETAAIMQAILATPRIAAEDGLYLAPAAALRARIAALDPAIGCAMIVGHNPGLEELVRALTAGAGLTADADGERFPTAAAACLRSPAASWRDFFARTPILAAGATPALLAGRARR